MPTVSPPRPVVTRNRAFSLLELLVVISIIAVLASIMMPGITMLREQARRMVCGSQMRQLGMALVSYKTENEGLYPTTYWNDPSWSTWSTWTYQTTSGRWQHFLEPYIGTYTVFNCPSCVRFYPNAAVRDVAIAGAPRGTAPANGVGTWGTCLTAINTLNFGRPPSWTSPGNMSDSKVDAYIHANQPTATRARCPVFFDGVWQNDVPNQANNGWKCYFPHRLSTNCVFDDGHVEFKAKSAFTSYSPVVQVSD